MKQKKSISAPKKGMNRDVHISQLKNTDYTIGVNIDTSNESGDSFNVQLEPSNYYGVLFPATYKVIGYKSNLLKNRTYYFLTSTETNTSSVNYKRSSIGYVDDYIEDTYNTDPTQTTDCDECESENVLSTPLENIIQTPSMEYVELVHDRCINLADIKDKGLNFDINFPIKTIEIKQEKLATKLYWEDYRNRFRNLNVTNIEEAKENGVADYLHLQEVPCSDPIEVDCLLVDKLLAEPDHKRIVLDAKETQTGGNLKMGTYEFYAAYCDLFGNEMDEYCTPTNPISIHDEYNNIIAQTETDAFTNFAIKIKVNNLDTINYKYYKIAVVERNNVNATQSVFLAGIYPTTDDVILYTHSGSSNDDLYIARGNVSVKKRMDFQTLTLFKPNYEKAKGTMTNGKQLFRYGLVVEEEMNLQPVVNIFSSLLNWQTAVAKETLFKNLIATSKYKYHRRNEVHTFGMRFLSKRNGGYTSTFTFIGRPKIDNDRILVDDINFDSVKKNSKYCNDCDEDFSCRQERWQIFNTAEIYEDTSSCNTIEYIDSEEETITKTCSIKDVAQTGTNFTIIPLDSAFSTLKKYSENHTIPEIEPFLNATYPGVCIPTFSGNCNDLQLITTENVVGAVVNEKQIYIPKTESEYKKSIVPSSCTQYKRNTTTGEYEKDVDFANNYLSPNFPFNEFVYVRDSNFLNEDCEYATTLQPQNNPLQAGGAIFLNYAGGLTTNDLQTIFNTFIGDSEFYPKLHKSAQYFSTKKNTNNKLILEFTKATNCQSDLDKLPYGLNKIRYTIYTSCTDTTVLGGGIVDLNSGLIKIYDATSFPSEVIIAIDAPIREHNGKYLVVPPCGCFSFYNREEENKEIKVSWDNIIIDKQMTYTKKCTFQVPKVNDCDPIPYQKGRMAYWQSTKTYPDNKELYDSSILEIKPSDIENLSAKDKENFLLYYTDGVNQQGNYTLKDVDFRCKNIRHFKTPDNTLVPFMSDNSSLISYADSLIYILGVSLDSKVVTTMLDVAYNNGLITKKQREDIYGYEILRGDNSIHKSVIADGIVSDMYNYTQDGEKIHYANFPYNDLGENKFCINPATNNLIQHPYGGTQNHLFALISPDIFLTKPSIPNEVTLQGYQFGNAETAFDDVKKHPKWTVLGSEARRIADTLATLEFTLEVAANLSQITKEQWASFGTSSGGNYGFAIATASWILGSTLGAVTRVGKYRYDWLTIFRDLGRTDNFATFQYSSAKYNRFLKTDQYGTEYLRGLSARSYLRDGRYDIIDENDNTKTKINNWLREYSVFLSTGKDFPYTYPDEYINYDNNLKNSNSSTFVMSDVGCEKTGTRFTRDVASPYFSLKNYIPDQWDEIDNIKWLTTNYIFNLDDDTTCKPIFGGTVCISRFSWRKKVPIFRDNAMYLADKLPFLYNKHTNIGKPKYYCNYESKEDNIVNVLGIPFPDIDSDIELDCLSGDDSFYVRPPSKFYLYVHGIVDFLVESEINCNFRHAKADPKDWLYNNQSLSTWLQEDNLSINEPNTFYYNNTYTFPVSNTNTKKLDRSYSKDVWNRRRFMHNAWVWSEADTNENALIDPWIVNKPSNFWEDKTNKGLLINLKSIESEQFLGRYENQLQLYNAIDNIAERITPQNRETGTGFLYQRPIEYKATDLGFLGTQHTDMASTPYGHFWVDAKRGRIFKIDQSGQQMEIISENIGGQPSNMREWFREHLPLKILRDKDISKMNIDVDNKFKGIGYNIWYDDRKARVFFTKRDYVVKKKIGLKYNDEIGFYINDSTPIYFDNTEYFEDVSFTISYKPTEGSWNSYFTFYPDYSPYHQSYFQTGYNWGEYKGTMWNHLMNNKSFGVFQGNFNPSSIEFPITNENANKILNSITLYVEGRRYQNFWDFVVHKEIGFDEMYIWNNTNNTGLLGLNPQKTITDNSKYPITNASGTKQEILFTPVEDAHNINYFFNRLINQDNNIPMFIKDKNNIFKTINPKAVKFGGKKIMERMKGEVFVVHLINTKNSRFNIILEKTINSETVYE